MVTKYRTMRLGPELVTAAVLALLAGATPDISAQSSQWSTELPAAERVIADMNGRTDREAAARRIAALQILTGVTRALSAVGTADPAATARAREYEQAARGISQSASAKFDANCTGEHCEKYLLPRCSYGYSMEPAMYREVLDRYFSKQWQAANVPRLRGDLWVKAQALPVGTTAQGRLIPAAAEACTRGGFGQWVGNIKSYFTSGATSRPGTGGSFSLSWLIPALLLAGAAWWLRPRSIVTVAGRIEALGESIKKPGRDKRYDYISIVRDDGGSTMIRKVDVPDEIDRILFAGAEGVFMVQRVFWMRQLVAARAGQRHAISSVYTWSPPGFYLRLVFGGGLVVFSLALLGLIMMVTIVGLVLVPVLWGMALIIAAMLVYVAIFYPLWRTQLYAALRAEGIDKLPKTVEI